MRPYCFFIWCFIFFCACSQPNPKTINENQEDITSDRTIMLACCDEVNYRKQVLIEEGTINVNDLANNSNKQSPLKMSRLICHNQYTEINRNISSHSCLYKVFDAIVSIRDKEYQAKLHEYYPNTDSMKYFFNQLVELNKKNDCLKGDYKTRVFYISISDKENVFPFIELYRKDFDLDTRLQLEECCIQ